MRKSTLIVANTSNRSVVGQNTSFFCLLYRRDPPFAVPTPKTWSATDATIVPAMATAANWFSETIKGKKAAIRDSAVTLKQIRKLVHPARYLQESSREISHRKISRFFL
jgi:hypothetical protein